MTEKNLFRTTSVVLAATLLVPLIAGLINTGAPDTAKTSQRINSYLTGTALSVAQSESTKANKATEEKNADDSDKTSDENTKNEGKSQGGDQNNQSSTNTQSGKSTSGATVGVKSAGKYTVQAGDTYGCIAESYYGSYEQWPKVYAANAGWPGFGEYDLAVGANLVMPAVGVGEVLPATSVCSTK